MENSIKRRLDALPRKVAQTLIRLAEHGQPQSGLIVEPIRLDWLPKQWITENNRLLCILDLRKHTAANVPYEISKWQAALPQGFPGYVVPSSRRLAAIGLRQRRRLISYHDRIIAGELAIVCVFLDRMRWVVEVVRTFDPDMPLEIEFIWKPGGGSANLAEELRISQVLGISPNARPAPAGVLISYRLWGMNKARASKVLSVAGISYVLPAADLGALHTARCSLHEWLTGYFEERRDHYCQFLDRPALFCETRFDMEASSVHTKLTVRMDEAGGQAVVRSFTDWIDHHIEAETICDICSLAHRR